MISFKDVSIKKNKKSFYYYLDNQPYFMKQKEMKN